MSRTAKIVLGICAGLLGLCLIAFAGLLALSGIAVTAVTREARFSTPTEMVGYAMPQGYHFGFDVHLLGGTLVGLDADNGQGHIYLAQLPPNLGGERLGLDHEFRRSVAQQTYGRRDAPRLHQVGTVEKTVAGQKVTFYISEGTNSANEPYREMAGYYNGPDGDVVILIAGRFSGWDDEKIDGFLGSIN